MENNNYSNEVVIKIFILDSQFDEIISKISGRFNELCPVYIQWAIIQFEKIRK